MADTPVAFAVLGSSPLALLLAGLLADTHGKSVWLVSETHSPFRLTRGFDLSVAPITRPETWLLLSKTVPEVRKLLGSFGAKAALERVDPLLVAETDEGREALMHMRHIALAHGLATDPVREDSSGRSFRARDALLVNRTLLAAPVGKWLERVGVRRLAADTATIELRRDGARITAGDTVLEVEQVIAADDGAILAHLDASDRERLWRLEATTTILTEPMRALPAPLTLVVDRGIVVLQRKGGAVQAVTGGDAEGLSRLATRLGGSGKARRAGQTSFAALVPRDSAPLIGAGKSLKAGVVSGFGPVAAFMAPAIARYFAGAATPEELAFFAAREVGRETERASASDYPGAISLGSAA